MVLLVFTYKLLFHIKNLFHRDFDHMLSRQPRSRAIEETGEKSNYFQGLISRLCPNVVICKDKNDTSKFNLECNVDPNRADDRIQTSGFVRILNTTCKNWEASRLMYEKQLVVVECTEDAVEEVSLFAPSPKKFGVLLVTTNTNK